MVKNRSTRFCTGLKCIDELKLFGAFQYKTQTNHFVQVDLNFKPFIVVYITRVRGGNRRKNYRTARISKSHCQVDQCSKEHLDTRFALFFMKENCNYGSVTLTRNRLTPTGRTLFWLRIEHRILSFRVTARGPFRTNKSAWCSIFWLVHLKLVIL